MKSLSLLSSLLVAGAATSALAQTPAEFYKGKPVRMVIGAAAGGGYDVPGRVMQAHMGRHIPGNPAIVVENMPGAASLIMTNFLYNRAPRDGTVMGMPNNSVPLENPLARWRRCSLRCFEVHLDRVARAGAANPLDLVGCGPEF